MKGCMRFPDAMSVCKCFGEIVSVFPASLGVDQRQADPEAYYTVSPAPRIRRQRVNFNVLGESRFCPVVRRTEALKRFEAMGDFSSAGVLRLIPVA